MNSESVIRASLADSHVNAQPNVYKDKLLTNS